MNTSKEQFCILQKQPKIEMIVLRGCLMSLIDVNLVLSQAVKCALCWFLLWL